MSRLIRNARAQELQGRRAGMGSRALADAVDVGIAFALYLVISGAVNLAWDLFFSARIELTKPPGWVTGTAVFAVLVIYLALGWGSTGRTVGKQLMGLRVVRADTRVLRPRQALGRALLCAMFYPGLLLAMVHRRNQSLQDLICKTVVVYDWIPEAGRPRVLPAPPAYVAPATVRSGEAGA